VISLLSLTPSRTSTPPRISATEDKSVKFSACSAGAWSTAAMTVSKAGTASKLAGKRVREFP
jgi:hypothetical protein